MGKVILQKVVEKCDEWLSTRNKKKVPNSSRLIKKHPLSCIKMSSGLVLTQNSPPPPELKTNTRQSNITSFFKMSGEITPGVGDKKTGRKLHLKHNADECGDGCYQTQKKKFPFSMKEYEQNENSENIDIKLTKDNNCLSHSYLPSNNFLENTTTEHLEEGTEPKGSHSSCWQNEKTSVHNRGSKMSSEGDILHNSCNIGNDLDSESAVEESHEKFHKNSNKLHRKNKLDSSNHHTLSGTVVPVLGVGQDSCESICTSETDLEMSDHKWKNTRIYNENNERVTRRNSLQEKPITANTGVKCCDVVERGAGFSCTCYEFSSNTSDAVSQADSQAHEHVFSFDSVDSFESFELTEDIDNLQFSSRRHLLSSEEADLELQDFSLSMHV